ncbi:MAG: hypothetical protein PVF73_11085 [Bacteroidales bacterium]|jgi:hypothetical protein
MITLHTYGGLGNRIRSIDSLLAITAQHKREITVIWERTYILNCKFSDLFILPDFVHMIEKASSNSPLGMKVINGYRKIMRMLGVRIPSGYDKYIFEDDLKKLKTGDYDFTDFLNYDSLFIETQHRFYSNGNDFALFRPVSGIENRVKKISEKFTKNTVGLHIRRTDNKLSIENSPLELFISAMNDELEANSGTVFFLATDSSDVEKELNDLFPGKIITQQNKELSRNSEQGIQDALVDMLCLSRTKKIYGSFWSSFSEIAAAFGKIDLKIISKATPSWDQIPKGL